MTTWYKLGKVEAFDQAIETLRTCFTATFREEILSHFPLYFVLIGQPLHIA